VIIKSEKITGSGHVIGYRMMHLTCIQIPERIYGEEGDRTVTVVFSTQIVLPRQERKHLKNTAT